jgi:metal-sulfur cluster biosynthetic enzyme
LGRKHAALQRRVARLAADWRDDHDELPWSKRDIVKGVQVQEDGEVTIALTPSRPHCPCCLLDLNRFRKKLLELKGVTFATIEVVGVPAADRWSKAINQSDFAR